MISKTLIQNSYVISGFGSFVLVLKSSFYHLDSFTISSKLDFSISCTKLLFYLFSFITIINSILLFSKLLQTRFVIKFYILVEICTSGFTTLLLMLFYLYYYVPLYDDIIKRFSITIPKIFL